MELLFQLGHSSNRKGIALKGVTADTVTARGNHGRCLTFDSSDWLTCKSRQLQHNQVIKTLTVTAELVSVRYTDQRQASAIQRSRRME